MSSNQPSPWTGHPLLVKAQVLPYAVDLYLQFTVWEPTTDTYVSLPSGITVDLMAVVAGSDVSMLSAVTDGQGIAHFYAASNQNLSHPHAPIYFKVNTNGRTFSTTPSSSYTLPASWSTKRGWTSADGLLIDKAPLNPIGTASSPVIYHVGLTYHFAINYLTNLGFIPALRNIETYITFQHGLQWQSRLALLDDNGSIHGTIFDAHPDSTITIDVWYRTQSGTGADKFPNLDNLSVTDRNQLSYTAKFVDGVPAIAGKTLIGTKSAPAQIRIMNDRACATLYCIKSIAELSQFMERICDGTWSWYNFSGVSVTVNALLATASHSWPVGTVKIRNSDGYDRDTQIHEMSHQIMWEYGQFSTWGLAATYVGPDASLNHWEYKYENPTHALLEGWGAFFGRFFAWNRPVYFDVSNYIISSPHPDAGSNPNPIQSPNPTYPYPEIKVGWPPNWGENVEGMFAAGLVELVRQYVIAGSGLPLLVPAVPETIAADLSLSMPWLFTTSPEATLARKRFAGVVMKPLQSLANLNNPSVCDFLDAIRSFNSQDWTIIRPFLQAFALAFPTIDKYGPLSGPFVSNGEIAVSQGQSIKLVGKHFWTGNTDVWVGSAAISGVVVDDAYGATIIVPPNPDTTKSIHEVKLQTPDGVHTIANAFHYL